MKKMPAPWLFFLVVILIPVSAFALVMFYEQRLRRLPVLVAPDHRIEHFELSNQFGKTVSCDDWKGHIVVANFFFTHCPSICPKMMYGMKRVQAYAQAPGILFASFTVDPERDSTARLREYAEGAAIGGNWNLLRGEKRVLYRLARNSFKVSATDGDGGPNDFIHSDQLVLIDGSGRIRGFYKGTDEKEVADLVRDTERLRDESGTPDEDQP